MISKVELTHFLSAFCHLIAEYKLDSHDCGVFVLHFLNMFLATTLSVNWQQPQIWAAVLKVVRYSTVSAGHVIYRAMTEYVQHINIVFYNAILQLQMQYAGVNSIQAESSKFYSSLLRVTVINKTHNSNMTLLNQVLFEFKCNCTLAAQLHLAAWCCIWDLTARPYMNSLSR